MGEITYRDDDLAVAIATAARPLESDADLEGLVELAAPARFVLMGEASHGTHEFYRLRAELTRRLIARSGRVAAIAIEGDWPDTQVVNRLVKGHMPHADAVEALGGFRRFPAWMWRNADMLDFVGWLRGHNERHSPKVGIYGLDLYSLHSSMVEVVRYLEGADPEAARRARERYACFEHVGAHLDEPAGTEDVGQLYGHAAGLGLGPDCEAEVLAQLIELQDRRRKSMVHDDELDALFGAEQNAKVVKNAEEYYRTMMGGRVSSWNLRDTHMADTLDALAEHTGGQVIVWAHNSHVGDARATQLALIGELNLGQLTRARHPGETCLIGFTTNTGTVTAASDWGEPAERMTVRRALPGSVEALFHRSGVPRFSLLMDELGERAGALREPRLERAIGVVYRPDTERQSHYFHTRLAAQFDAVIHVDETRAVEPLERGQAWSEEAPETFPSGL